mmetsp:Transcript_45469/g.131639  ORF Transcript_45469/g.131639 Transcript_45469/m.131639 type:complete len:113 (-) Transcript_45469:410-748(-)
MAPDILGLSLMVLACLRCTKRMKLDCVWRCRAARAPSPLVPVDWGRLPPGDSASARVPGSKPGSATRGVLFACLGLKGEFRTESDSLEALLSAFSPSGPFSPLDELLRCEGT